MALVLLLANHVSVGPSLVGAVSDQPEVDSPADVYLSFFEPENGNKREKTLLWNPTQI